MRLLVILCLLFVNTVWATNFTDLKFGQYQTADSQWNTQSCLYNPQNYGGCQIYSKNPGITYKIPWTSGKWTWSAGQYVKFEASGNASYPYVAKIYNANGSYAGQLGTGKVIYVGDDGTNGYFFFMGNDNNTGQLFSLSQGMDTRDGLIMVGSANPDESTLNSFASGYGSTEPLAQGESVSTGPTTTTVTGVSGGISASQTTQVNAAKARLNSYGNDSNSIYIDQAGNNNTIEITQKGTSGNHIRGIDGTSAGVITGDLNTIDIKQGATTSTDSNLIELSVIGSVNDITLYQDRSDIGAEDSSASGSHVMRLSIDGNSNTVNTMQRSEANKAGHFGEITLVGDSNNIDLYQRAETGLLAFIDVTGNSNLINLTQTNTLGDGNHFADITLIGDGHQVNLTQNGSGSHNANISLTNGSAPSTLDLNQSGSTAQSYSLEQTCYTLGGCSATVSQY